MGIVLPHYLQAKNLVSLKLSGANPAANGSLTWSTAVDIAINQADSPKTFKALTYNNSPQRVNITPSDSGIENEVIERERPSVTVQEIARSGAVSVLETLAAQYDYIRVEALYRQRGAVSGGILFVFVGVRGDNDGGVVPGENVRRLDLGPCGYAPYIGAGPSPI
jgi:hypothetical protein